MRLRWEPSLSVGLHIGGSPFGPRSEVLSFKVPTSHRSQASNIVNHSSHWSVYLGVPWAV